MDVFAKRLQLQERLGAQIANSVFEELGAKGVMVIIEAEHTCMTARGVKKIGTKTVTAAVRGDMPNDLQSRIISMINRG